MVIEGITRFGLDFWRIVDKTYLGLTPTQYVAIPMIGLGLWLILRNTSPSVPLIRKEREVV
jgi:prolipoprotein diacylglyceryltransferase